MLIDEVLQGAGFVKNKSYRETRFLKAPPYNAYCTYSDSTERMGDDKEAYAIYHSVSIAYYELAPDDATAMELEESLDAHYWKTVDGWRKMERYWIDTGQIYQTVYEFDFIEKIDKE